jgi:hypothetical protein
MQRRAEAGLLAPTLIEEGRHLAAWGQGEFPGKAIPAPKSIVDKLGSFYWELKAKARR